MPKDIEQRLGHARLLFLEHSPVGRSQFAEACKALGIADCHYARTPEEAIGLWHRLQPDVTLVETGSKVHDDHLEVLHEIRANDPDAAIIVLSGQRTADHLQRALEVGVDGYLALPPALSALRKMLARALQKRERLIDLRLGRMVFEVANEGIMVTDAEPRILAINPAFTEITGYRPHEVIGRKPSMLSAGLVSPSFYKGVWETLNTHGRWAGEIINRRRNGEVFSEWLSIAAVEGELNGSQRYVGLISDISERKKEEERMRFLAHFDSLTGLANRVLFNEQLHRSLARSDRYGETLAVMYLDLDRFKDINDTYGHAIGDEVLRITAQRMRDTLRRTDMVSRRGGDEFVILLELDGHPEGIGSICGKLLVELAHPIEFGDQLIYPTASIGVAIYPTDAANEMELLAAADAALYEAKAAGRNRFHIFRSEAQNQARSRLNMERELREGLRDWRYSLRYLPEISLKTGEVENVEALLRFHHPEFGLLEAGRFLEVAEQIGIMPELGQKALAEAVRELSSLGGEREIGLVVDLSSRQLAAPNALSGLLNVLKSAGLPNRLITFECPEAALGGNQLAMETLYGLSLSGCKFTLDDFGAGYCSFGLLSQLPMNSIKIDRSFIAEIDASSQIRELVAALIAFVRRLGLRVVAEGVEHPSQLAFLRAAGCDTAQGYVFGRPMTGEALNEFLSRQSWREMLQIPGA